MNHLNDILPPLDEIRRNVTAALAEDVGSGDVTARLIPESAQAQATVLCRESAVLCGTAWFDEVFAQLDPAIAVEWHAGDGDRLAPDQRLCTLHGPARGLLTGERTALNFLQMLSGTATLARRYADAVAGTNVQVLDTRKTLPGLRLAQKYAVRCGGCRNHRVGLYDAVLIKENHILAAGSIQEAIGTMRTLADSLPIEVEVEDMDELRDALQAGADVILLDNFQVRMLIEAVQETRGRAKLEASGGINLENIRTIAETGVDYISIGALTKDLAAIDLSMRIQSRSP